jgi:hypothetical protein
VRAKYLRGIALDDERLDLYWKFVASNVCQGLRQLILGDAGKPLFIDGQVE